MTSAIADPDILPFYLEGERGPLFAVYYRPVGALHPLGDVLVAPAFAEEMNRCRSMVSMQARALAAIGIGTLVLDPYGTGDSGGEFVDGTWTLWRADLLRGIEWLRREGNGCRTLWGIRLGALMAMELAVHDSGIERLVFWQPVLDGKSFFTQFLRIRIAAELEQNGGIKTTDELRKMCAAGESIEVSGYRISPALAQELDFIRMPDPPLLQGKHIVWRETLAAADSVLPRTSTKALDACRAAGVRIDFASVVGPPFWQVHERAVAPDLIDATTARLRESTDVVPSLPLGNGASCGANAESSAAEEPLMFPCESEHLLGITNRGDGRRRGVVIIVAGGPQYRAGAHRQFVSLARKLSSFGFPVLRFDLRGMGDSSGRHLGFEHSEEDIKAAIDALVTKFSLEEVVLFGECESASAILFYAYRDPRVKGIVLVNPWVRTEGGRAGVIMKHYYVQRLVSPLFWRKVLSGQFRLGESAVSFASTLRTYLRGRRSLLAGAAEPHHDISGLPLPERTAAGMRRFRGPVMILMSGHDYIAREFDEVVQASDAWRGVLEQPRVRRRDLHGADHTFSREVWKLQASDWVCEWVASW